MTCRASQVAIAVALADKLDMLVGFWAIDEKPTGSKDPYALRRAALGLIRIALENDLRLPLNDVTRAALMKWKNIPAGAETQQSLLAFFADRLKVHLRDQGARHDLVDAVFALGGDDLLMIVRRVEALGLFLDTEDGEHLLTGTKRAINILRIEEKKDSCSYDQPPDASLLKQPEEKALAKTVDEVERAAAAAVAREDFEAAMAAMAKLRCAGRCLLRQRHGQHRRCRAPREPPAPAQPHPRHDADRRRFLQDRGVSIVPAHISLITLGVADVAKATAFYERLGFDQVEDASQESVSFFQAGPVVLALWGRDAQRDDAEAAAVWTGNGGIVVAQNLPSEDAVDVMMARAEASGARVLKPAAKTFWGGYNGYFADPDGHVWEVAFNPFWELDEDGRVKLPE